MLNEVFLENSKDILFDSVLEKKYIEMVELPSEGL